MNYKPSLVILLLLCVAHTAQAQSYEDYARKAAEDMKRMQAQAQEEYEKFSEKTQRDYETFRDKANKAYADFIRTTWEARNAMEAIPMPERPEPPVPMVKDSTVEKPTVPKPLITPIHEPEPEPEPEPKPEPEPEPKLEPKPKLEPQFEFGYYGTKCKLSLNESHRFTLPHLNNDSVADMWEYMSNDNYYAVADELIQLREHLNLGDWGFVKLTECAARAFLGDGLPNEVRLMQIFFLAQGGLKVRMAQADDILLLLLPSSIDVYGYRYVSTDAGKYYIINNEREWGEINLLDKEFPEERVCSMAMQSTPQLSLNATPLRTLTSKRFPKMRVEISTNENLIDFYNDYPLSSAWGMYARTPLSDGVEQALFAQLQRVLATTSSELEAAEMLLNFVQTAFEYQTDQQQFGTERPLFAEETFYYPYCDCEDRSILFSMLVRELLGLDVVLLHYPNHLATAVCFNEDAVGNYIEYNNKRYFVCDPTYIGASIGEVMPQLLNKEVKIIN